MSELINFSWNWNNKLNGTAFSTVRLKSPKYQKAALYKVVYQPSSKQPPVALGLARVVSLAEKHLHQITEGTAIMDTGLPLSDYYGADGKPKKGFISLVRTMYPRVVNWQAQPIYVLVLAFEERWAYLPQLKERDSTAEMAEGPAGLFAPHESEFANGQQ
jgi:hypothetical protein